MTFEEAKEQLRELILDTESLIVGDAAKGIYRKDLEALKKAVEALEKQMPKRFEIDEWYPRDRFCPRCFEDFTKTDARCRDYEPWRYCPSCGQALDWSEKI